MKADGSTDLRRYFGFLINYSGQRHSEIVLGFPQSSKSRNRIAPAPAPLQIRIIGAQTRIGGEFAVEVARGRGRRRARLSLISRVGLHQLDSIGQYVFNQTNA
jgi:hypothetical protein